MAERYDFLKYTCQKIDNDLKFAEKKNAFLVTFNAAIFGVVVNFWKSNLNFSKLEKLLILLFIIIVICSTIISLFSFLPKNPFRKFLVYKISKSNKMDCTTNNTDQTSKLLYYEYVFISAFNSDEVHITYESFYNTLKQNTDSNEFSFFEKQYISQIVDLSDIAYTKFSMFSLSFKIEILAFIVFIAFLILMLL